ncbi:MAG: C-terminal binding protein [Acidimicrobiales bacterium]
MSVKVVKTDGDFRNPEIERAILGRIGAEYVELRQPTPDELVARARDADAVMILSYPLSGALLEELPHVKVVSRYGVGVDMVDVQAATSLGIAVSCVPDYCVDEVSSHAVTLMLVVWRKLFTLSGLAAAGTFPAMEAARPVHRLAGAKVGLVGFGALGQAVAHKLSGFDVEIMAIDPQVPADIFIEHGVQAVGLNKLLDTADIVSIHTSLTSATFHLIGEDQIARMKRGAIVINTARGAVVDQVHLAAALRSGHLAGAGLDVLETEPPAPDDELLHLPNVVVTPHVAAYSEEAMVMLQERAASAVVDVLSTTRPPHLVNPEVWDHRRR